jgi:Flp pilus assembly pilin Flp
MRLVYLNLVVQLQRLLMPEDGQDMIEYALLAFLIACGAVASIGTVAAGVAPAFSGIAERFNSAVAGVGS